jgi:uncharacterized protein (DUF2267 family)
MGALTRRTAVGVALVGAAVLFRPGTRAHRLLRHQAGTAGRHFRHLGGRLQGVSYRMSGRHPDPDVPDDLLADRIRSSIGTLEKRLDLPRVHVMAEDHIALLHGEVATASDADEIETAVAAVAGVLGVESYLHVGLGPGDTRPSTGRATRQPSQARRQLLGAATSAGVDPAAAPGVVRGVLAAFAERLPADERGHVAAHLPTDVRPMFTPPRRIRRRPPVRTVPQLVDRIAASTTELPRDNALEVTRAVVRELRALVPEESSDIADVLPEDLRDLWSPEPPDRTFQARPRC